MQGEDLEEYNKYRKLCVMCLISKLNDNFSKSVGNVAVSVLKVLASHSSET